MTKQTAAKTTNTEAKAAPKGKGDNVTTLVTASKIDRAKAMFAEISNENYEPAEGSSPRKDFINKCVSELGMTENGASTYWQNLRNDSKGEGMYKNGKPATGLPRGRRPDMQGKMKKAAAKVERLQLKVQDDLKALQDAQHELVAVAQEVSGAPAQAAS